MAAADQTLAGAWQGWSALPEMDAHQFSRWAELLERRTGMALPPERKSFLVTSVGLRMREIGFSDYDAYYRHLVSGVAGNVEWAALVDRLTVHETRFFRDPRALDYLARRLLPAGDAGGGPELNLWSVGCSTGEEVYSLAMVLAEGLRERSVAPHFGVTGTDISLHALSVGRQATYASRCLGDIPEGLRGRYCEPLPGRDRFRMIPSLRRRVGFAQMNVLDAGRTRSLQMDGIYCQNLLIYFDRARRQAIVDGLARHLRPGGLLILGAGEFVRGRPDGLERVPGSGEVVAFRRAESSRVGAVNE